MRDRKPIDDYLEILSSPKRLNSDLVKELEEINAKIDSPRKTEISDNEEIIDDESLTSEVVVAANTGYIKRVPLSSPFPKEEVRESWNDNERRGFVNEVFVVNTSPLLFFHLWELFINSKHISYHLEVLHQKVRH